MSAQKKLIPFRTQSESFTAFRDDGCYDVDKTGVIRYLIERGDKICVFTRPLARTVRAYAVCFCRKWCVVREVK